MVRSRISALTLTFPWVDSTLIASRHIVQLPQSTHYRLPDLNLDGLTPNNQGLIKETILSNYQVRPLNPTSLSSNNLDILQFKPILLRLASPCTAHHPRPLESTLSGFTGLDSTRSTTERNGNAMFSPNRILRDIYKSANIFPGWHLRRPRHETTFARDYNQ
jgi:hypothetical protein